MAKDLLVLRDLTDEELDNLSDETLYELSEAYKKEGVPYRATVRGLLEENDISITGLSDFILGLNVAGVIMLNAQKIR